jgi:Rrf2 family transcriptional regulator, nitric oxide-sensitive transcriptional repressor
MQLTLHTDYALRLLIYLAIHPDRPATVQGVAEAYGISANHLAKVAQSLVQAGYVRSARGRGGGLHLAALPDTMNLGEIVRQLEGTRTLVACFGDDSDCPIEPECGLKRVLKQAQDAFFAELDHYTLADLLKKPQRLATLLVRGSPYSRRATGS